MKLFYDNNGEAYRIEEEDRDRVGPSFHLRIHASHTQSSWIGFANFLWEDKTTLKLADIRTSENAIIHFRRFRFLGVFSPVRREDRNCQRLGLGTQLLKHSLERVKALGVKRVWGNITADDQQKNPKLPEWYESFGFDVKLSEADSGDFATIDLNF